MSRVKIGSVSKEDAEFKVTDYGLRKVISQYFSRLVTISKDALVDSVTGQEAKHIHLEWVHTEGASYIKVTPIFEAGPKEI